MTRKYGIRAVACAIVMTFATGIVLARTPINRAGTVFDAVLTHYEAIHKALASDSLAGVAEQARVIRDTVDEAAPAFTPDRAGVAAAQGARIRALLPKVEGAAARLATATTLEQAREAFGELSRLMAGWLERVSGHDKLNVVYCPMVKKPWLQQAGQIANPYLGSKMLRCGTIVSR